MRFDIPKIDDNGCVISGLGGIAAKGFTKQEPSGGLREGSYS